MARCMLKQRSITNSLWGEAVTTVAYVLNRCPTERLKNKVPEEVWSGKKPSINHLRVFFQYVISMFLMLEGRN